MRHFSLPAGPPLCKPLGASMRQNQSGLSARCIPAVPPVDACTPVAASPLSKPCRATTLAAAAPRRHRPAAPRASIGFDLPGGAEGGPRSVEKQAEQLLRAASSLLLYQPVLRGKPATAFLTLLAALAGGPPTRALESYGELFRALAADGHASWQDYVLDQILRGVDNPLSRAAARGEPTGHLLPAAAADLDTLQSLAVESDRLVRWITDSVAGLPDGWAAAAAASLAPAPQQPHGGGGPEAAFALPPGPPEALLAPLTPVQRASARAMVGGWQRWSSAVQSLQLYYASYGHGLLPGHRVLQWNGKLEGQDALKGVNALDALAEQGLVAHEHHATKALVSALSTFLAAPLVGDPPAPAAPPPHAAVVGAPLDCWAHTCYALQHLPALVQPDLREAAEGLRVVLLPAAQLPALPDLAWSLAAHARCRFAVVAGGLEGAPRRAEAAAVLSGVGGFAWPRNAVVLAAFPESGIPPELAPLFQERHRATVESLDYCA